MKIIFIRHGDPDYVADSLTEKGWREAELLSERVCNWSVTQFYCSPLGRAKDTASVTLNKMGRTAITCDWLRECYFDVYDPVTGEKHCPWDWLPEYWTKQPDFYIVDGWYKNKLFIGTEAESRFIETSKGIDKVLSSYGYTRANTDTLNPSPMYITSNTDTTDAYKTNDNRTLVFFCHFGVTAMIMAHLTGVSPVLLWHTFFCAPTAVTVMSSEERKAGVASFRCQVMGDTRHLFPEEPVSASGYFSDVFNG